MDESGVFQVPNNNVRWVLRQCRCFSDREKFKIRLKELREKYDRLILKNYHCQYDSFFDESYIELDRAATVMDEIVRIESILQVSEGCKNTFSCTWRGSPKQAQFGSYSQSPHGAAPASLQWSVKHPEKKVPHFLPEFLLASELKSESSIDLKNLKTQHNFTGPELRKRTSMPPSVTTWGEAHHSDVPVIAPHDGGHSVLVYGFRPESLTNFVHFFSLIGTVVKKTTPPDRNWAVFRYKYSQDAAKACSYNLMIVDGSVIGVTRCDDGCGENRFSHQRCYGSGPIEVIRNGYLKLIEGKLIRVPPARNAILVTKAKIRWALVVLATCTFVILNSSKQ